MNLLTDPWVPVRHKGVFKHICLQDVLCQEEDWELSCPRDDFELAALQLLICLTQVLFIPDDANKLRQREQNPLTESEYLKGIQSYLEWFDLLHPTQPFMQTRGVKAADVTPIQKLFIGLPEGNNHAFFNDAGEVKHIGLNYAALALFHQASNCPSFGGGFKGSLRGGAPLTTLIKGDNLRKTLWLNVLHQKFMQQQECKYSEVDKPVWGDPIKANDKIYPHQIGLMRGLFWQPAHIELATQKGTFTCDISGQPITVTVTSFNKEKFNYELVDSWLHPHSPRSWQEKKGQMEKRYASFTTTAPAWTQLTNYILIEESKKEGHSPALVVTQYSQVFAGRPLLLTVGGYRNKQASILERRHEIVGLSEGWENNTHVIKRFVQLALDIKKILRNQLYGFGKNIGVEGLADQAEDRFYQDSELIMHQIFRKMRWREATEYFQRLYQCLCQLARAIFIEVTYSYQHEPKMLRSLANARRFFNISLYKLNEIQEVA